MQTWKLVYFWTKSHIKWLCKKSVSVTNNSDDVVWYTFRINLTFTCSFEGAPKLRIQKTNFYVDKGYMDRSFPNSG